MPLTFFGNKRRFRFLLSRKDEYDKLQAQKKTKVFWVPLLADFFDLFPKDKAILEKRTGQLKTWFRNHNKRDVDKPVYRRSREDDDLLSSDSEDEEPIGQLSKPSPKHLKKQSLNAKVVTLIQGFRKKYTLPRHQAYSKLYWNDIGAGIEASWQEHVDEMLTADKSLRGLPAKELFKQTRNQRLDFINRKLRERYESASAEIKAAVEKFRSSVKDDDPDIAKQAAIDNMRKLWESILSNFAQQTGLCVSVIVAGPVPSCNGEIGFNSFHMGELNGRNFSQWYKNWTAAVREPYLEFISEVYEKIAEIEQTHATQEETPVGKGKGKQAETTHDRKGKGKQVVIDLTGSEPEDDGIHNRWLGEASAARNFKVEEQSLNEYGGDNEVGFSDDRSEIIEVDRNVVANAQTRQGAARLGDPFSLDDTSMDEDIEFLRDHYQQFSELDDEEQELYSTPGLSTYSRSSPVASTSAPKTTAPSIAPHLSSCLTNIDGSQTISSTTQESAHAKQSNLRGLMKTYGTVKPNLALDSQQDNNDSSVQTNDLADNQHSTKQSTSTLQHLSGTPNSQTHGQAQISKTQETKVVETNVQMLSATVSATRKVLDTQSIPNAQQTIITSKSQLPSILLPKTPYAVSLSPNNEQNKTESATASTSKSGNVKEGRKSNLGNKRAVLGDLGSAQNLMPQEDPEKSNEKITREIDSSLTSKGSESSGSYIKEAKAYLLVALQGRKLSLLDDWVMFEEQKGSDNSGKTELGELALRPAELTEFIRMHQFSTVSIPENAAEYGERWWTWWRALQPGWRKINGESKMRDHRHLPENENWDMLCIGGLDGILLAIVGVAIWNQSVMRTKIGGRKAGAEIEKALEDIHLVIQMMTVGWGAGDENKKRSGDNLDDVDMPAKKRGRKSAAKTQTG